MSQKDRVQLLDEACGQLAVSLHIVEESLEGIGMILDNVTDECWIAVCRRC